MAMLPLPDYCQIAPRRVGSGQRRDGQQQQITLQSFPELSLNLPANAYFLQAQKDLYADFSSAEVLANCIDYLQIVLDKLGLINSYLPAKLLLVLPDNTRTAIAVHLLLDAIFCLQKSHSNLQLTILFGLGTHPPMTEESISQYLGRERYKTIVSSGIVIRQQTTIAPLEPQAIIKVQDQVNLGEISTHSFANINSFIAQLEHTIHQAIAGFSDESLSDLDENLLIKDQLNIINRNQINLDKQNTVEILDNLTPTQTYELSLPQELWQHHLTIVAGDTELHPYEIRGGSGGLHKMLVVGLANIQAIRRSHSTKILLHSPTNRKKTENAFVHTLDYLAECLNQSLLTQTPHIARTYPLGFSIVSLQNQSINGFWFGQKDKNRQALTAIAKESRTVNLPEKIHILVVDTDKKKGTDILAGARALQYLCEWDDEDNCLLADTPRQRVALLFNPCREEQNHGGIGNQGTKKQLDVLQKLVSRRINLLEKELNTCQSLDSAMGIVKNYRREVLTAWTHHLQLTSEIDDFLVMINNLILIIQELRGLSMDETHAKEFLQATLANYANDYTEEGQSIQALLNIYLTEQNLPPLINKIEQLRQQHHLSEGLGEGGQRALRCLKLLHKFETFFLATDNQKVLNYLAQLDPDLTNYLPPLLKNILKRKNIRINLLGIWGIDLKNYSPQKCLDLAISYGKYYNQKSQDLHIAFLQEPLIICR
ncbi:MULTISPECIES: hypothetical protein [unclassified Synechocystis]|uniref:hypothetical protein n=1 Tax=unclassified Synechocystis TaxID=2640012 RepID=UPI0004055213|nr:MULTISPECIES: hypothetical protein [unclassified Synechocystis]AIE73639.1 hypothetical protein D082_11110 [Synechocystis sp. PCC 6714]MCT0254999.1 hypothetical protein [Synechocystis sp. CS-94]